MKKRMIVLVGVLLLMAGILIVTATATDVVASGNCGADGDNVTWTLDSDGLLVISGTGKMEDYPYSFHSYSLHWWCADGRYADDSVRTVRIESGVTSIGDGAFSGCFNLTSVTIPSSVTSIGGGAFYSCLSLTNVTIPNSVTFISDEAFHGCKGLTQIEVREENQYYTALNGVLMNKRQTELLCYPAGKQGTSYEVPNSVTSIGNWAFSHCDSLISVTISDSVISIGDAAFECCSSLTSVTMADSVTSIGDKAFYGCSSLTSMAIPDNVTSIGDLAFSYSGRLTQIEVSEKNQSYIALNGILMNKRQTELLCYPAGKQKTSYAIPDSVTSIGNGAFSYCIWLRSVTIPNSVSSIGDSAFLNCIGLTSVTIPDSVISIGSAAFDDCRNLTSVKIPNSVTSIGDATFHSCDSLTSVTIPDSVTSIGTWAFQGCRGLTSVIIPDSVTSIGNWAFASCAKLASAKIGKSVTFIGNWAFQGCDSLTDVYYAGTEAQWNTIAGHDNVPKSATIHCELNVSVTDVRLYNDDLTMQKGAHKLLYVSVLPSNASNKTVTWSSSDDSIVSVVNGRITAENLGNALITVTTDDGHYQAVCTVTVTEKPTLHALLINGLRGDNEAGTDNDVAMMYSMLCRNELSEYQIKTENIHLRAYNADDNTLQGDNLERKRQTIDGWIFSAFSNTTSNDMALFYYSGHDATFGIELSTFHTYEWERLIKSLNSISANHIVIIIDGCYSGGLISTLKTLPEVDATKFTILVACAENQESVNKIIVSLWGDKLSYGRFTYYIGEGIGFVDGNLDADTVPLNEKITMRELYQYVYLRVRSDKDNKKNPMTVEMYPNPADTQNDSRLNIVLFEYHHNLDEIWNSFTMSSSADSNETVSSLSNINLGALIDVIQSSNEIQEELFALEAAYREENHITVSAPVSTMTEISTSGIHLIGVGLSGLANDTLFLNIREPKATPGYDTDAYSNPVYFDMNLIVSNNGASAELDSLAIPAVITLPVPERMDMSRLRVLHFTDSGADEIRPDVDTQSRTAKFTVAELGAFAFMEIRDNVENSPITVYLDANGGSVAPLRIPVYVGDVYGNLPAPVRDGYNFVGWYTRKSGGERIFDTTEVSATSDHTLYAHWDEAELWLGIENLTFYANSLSCSFTASVHNTNAESVSGNLFAAVYQSQRMLNVISVSDLIVSGNSDIQRELRIPCPASVTDNTDDLTAKLFLLGDSFQPLTYAASKSVPSTTNSRFHSNWNGKLPINLKGNTNQ